LGAFSATALLNISSPRGVVFTDNYTDTGAGTTAVYTLTVPARTALTVQWTQVGFFGGNVTLQSATLAPVIAPGGRNAPSSPTGATGNNPVSPRTPAASLSHNPLSTRPFSTRTVPFSFDQTGRPALFTSSSDALLN